MEALSGLIDPELKRKAIGRVFVEVFDEASKQVDGAKWLGQGTIYPDVIESVSATGGPSATIKSHHNVGGLPDDMAMELVEPLRELFKDEVRKIGLELGLPYDMVYRHPFPGPGLGVRILGEVKKEYADLLREADAIFMEELHRADWYHKTSQAFAVFLPVKSVGVVGDARRYEYVIALRAVETIDFMTARWAHLPGFTPDGVVVLVDPLSVRDRAADRYVGETVVSQVAGADLVVVSRSDVADEEDLAGTEAWLSGMTDATVLRTPVPTAVLLGPRPRNLPAETAEDAPASTTPPHDHVSISRHLDGPIARTSIDTWIRARPGGVVRAKGLVRVDDRPDDRTVLQVCGSTTSVTVDGPWDGGAEVVVAIALPGTPRAALVKWLNLLG